jgi:hypothetical protein
MAGALDPRLGGERVGSPLNRLVARRHDIDAAQRALSESRLLTLTGPGGVGKTRLALELAYRASGKFPDGAWVVRLADLSVGAGPTEVDAALANALGVSDQSDIAWRADIVPADVGAVLDTVRGACIAPKIGRP